MVEFNQDGSLKLPEQFQKSKEQSSERMLSQRCIKIKKKVISFSAPKKCVLEIVLSKAMNDNRFVDTIYNYFREKAAVPTRISKINDKMFEIEIGTDFRRCTDCSSLISRYREFMDGSIIEEKGSCTFEKRNFCYEDHFE